MAHDGDKESQSENDSSTSNTQLSLIEDLTLEDAEGIEAHARHFMSLSGFSYDVSYKAIITSIQILAGDGNDS